MKPSYILFSIVFFLVSFKTLASNNSNETNSPKHFIGEQFGGGIVFYIYDDGQHGLIAAKQDLHPGIVWYNGLTRKVGKLEEGFGAGKSNTAFIINKLLPDDKDGMFAARICAEYSVTEKGNVYKDWYLPSKFELDLLYQQRKIVGGFTYDNYWSSNEYQFNSIWVQNFGNGQHRISNSESYGNAVRAIRAF
jgi:hypothetical protein